MRRDGRGLPRKGTRITGNREGIGTIRGSRHTPSPSATSADTANHSFAECAMSGVNPAAAQAVTSNG
jgi:hypothetical protein